jgi:hypothetical protein
MRHRNMIATLLVAASLSLMGERTYAAPLSASLSLRVAVPQNDETVRWRGAGFRGGWGGRGWGARGWGARGWVGRGWGGRGWGGGFGFGGIGLGLAAGALIGGALAAPYYGGYGYYGNGYGYGYAPAYYGGYWPGYRRRIIIVHRPYWGYW